MSRSYFEEAPLESALERDITTYAERRGWYVFKFTSPGKRHVQDRLFIRQKDLFGDTVVGITDEQVTREVLFGEIKREGEEERLAQAARRRQMQRHGAVCRVWDNIEDAKRDLR